MSPGRRLLLRASVLTVATGFATTASAITRDEVLVRARSYASHRWTSAQANTTASCSASYQSLYVPGDYVGVAYDWGGYMSISTFDSQIAQGYGAGAQEPDGILACTAGVDSSGFVSMAWGAGHFTTSSLAETSGQISASQMLPGDVYNKAGYHVAMQVATKANGEPLFIEALGYNVNTNSTGGLSHVAGYVPRRYDGITGATVSDPVGTTTRPIEIPAFPYSDMRDTRQSPSSVLDACATAPSIQQRGPEYVYVTKITQPGTLTVSVSDDGATDIDVQILAGAPSPARCVGRSDSTVSMTVGCGDYYIVADTFGANATNAGNYTLTASFTPSGQPCNAVAGPPAFEPKGRVGDACAFPGNKNLPFCNANLGADTCIYTQTESFCSVPCTVDAECGGMPGGGCCRDLGKGERYCMLQAFCAGGGSGATLGTNPTPTEPSGTSGGTSSGDPGATGEPGVEPDGMGEGAAGTTTVTKTTSGCATTPAARSPGGLGAIAIVLGALARRRRRAG